MSKIKAMSKKEAEFVESINDMIKNFDERNMTLEESISTLKGICLCLDAWLVHNKIHHGFSYLSSIDVPPGAVPGINSAFSSKDSPINPYRRKYLILK